MAWLTWILLAIAAAGPRTPLDARQAGVGHNLDIYVVLDMSASMNATDIAPSRLARAKLEIDDLLRRLHGERVALVAFSGSPAVIAMPTRDQALLRYYLGILHGGLFDVPGSDLGGALQLVRGMIEAQHRPAAVVLLSDLDASLLSGISGDRIRGALDAIRTSRTPTFALQTASYLGSMVLTARGQPLSDRGGTVISRPDAESFRELLAPTGGAVVTVADGDGDWRALYDRNIAKQPGAQRPAKGVITWRDWYAWFLAPALLLMLASGKLPAIRPAGRALPSVFLGAGLLFFAMPPAHANALASAYDAYRTKRYAAAEAAYRTIAGFTGRMGEGAAAYRRRNYRFAADQFTRALRLAETEAQRADALFNLGNSLAQSGQLVSAIDAYRDVLRYRPGDAASIANLAMVSAAARAAPRRNPQNAGIPGRRGIALSDAKFDSIDDKPVAMDIDPPDPAPTSREARQRALDASAAQARERVTKRRGQRASLDAAAKKLEMIQDHPQALQQALIRRDAKEYSGDVTMPPW